jgi:hypothetical protein
VSEGEKIALISGLSLIIVAGLNGLPAWLTYWQTLRNGAKLKQVHMEFNGRMDQLLATKDKLTEARVDGSFQEGIRQGEAKKDGQ